LRLLRAQPEPNIELIDGVRGWLGDAYISVNRLKDAEHILREVIDSDKQRHASELTLAVDKGLYGASLLYQHQFQTAEPFIQDSYQTTASILGRTHRRTIDSLALLCDLYSLSDQQKKTLQCRQEVYESTRTNNGSRHWSTLSALVDLGAAQYTLGHYSEAARSLGSATADLTHLRGIDKYVTQIANYYLARSLIQLHKDSARAQLLAQPLDPEVLRTGEPNAPWAMRIQLLRGMVLLSQGKRKEALQLLEPATHLQDDADTTDTILQEARQLLKSVSTNSNQQLANVD
jgi:predicted negative regulator of RcsB-dependent stress response